MVVGRLSYQCGCAAVYLLRNINTTAGCCPAVAAPPHLAAIPIASMSTKDRDEQQMIRLRNRAEMRPSDDDVEEDSLGKRSSHSDAFLLTLHQYS